MSCYFNLAYLTPPTRYSTRMGIISDRFLPHFYLTPLSHLHRGEGLGGEVNLSL
jgi:hypothetical protein